jgi:Spy/CpxP family protein refolding chaperone
MNRKFFNLIGAAALAGGALLAQDTGAATSAPSTPGAMTGHRMHRHFGKRLNLTGDQKTQAKSIFSDARQQAQPLRQQMAENRKAVRDAVQSGAPQAQIDELAAKAGPLASQLAVIRTESFAKFYAILTPEQRTQVNQHKGRFGRHAQPTAPSGE